MGKASELGKQRSVTQGCCGIPLFQRIYSTKSKIETTGVSTGRGKIQPEKDPSSEDLLALNTTKANVAGRRLRSDSPTEDGAFESQPLKRQNSLGEIDPPNMGSNGPRSIPASPPSSHLTAATTLQQQQQQPQTATTDQHPVIMEKSQTYPPPGRAGGGRTKRAQDAQQMYSATGPLPIGSECPPYGSKSVIGRRAKMEDAFKAVPNLLQVPLHREADEVLPPRLAPQLRTNSNSNSSSRGSAETAAAAAVSASENQQQAGSTTSGSAITQNKPPGLTINPLEESSVEVLHFFGVFDGHGGADAAMHCAKTLHERVKQVLSAITTPSGGSGNMGTPSPTEEARNEENKKSPEDDNTRENGAPAAAAADGGGAVEESSTSQDAVAAGAGTDTEVPLSSAFESGSSDIDFMDAVDMDASDGGEGLLDDGAVIRPSGGLSHAASIEGLLCTTETVEAALTKAFHLTDEEFGEMGGYEHLALVGTTAVVALVGSRMIYVANCGDSRAVLCRDGQAIALSDDHKAAREDETARVEAAGGQILFWNGVRVMGLLAVSRAIGDHSLRPYVIAEPEVTIVNRHPDDEVLIMASDGLWDVMSNQEACNLAKKCLLRARQRGSTRHSAAKVAATVLTRAAVDRGSRDNVTVVIVDLTSELEGEEIEGGDRENTSAPLPAKYSSKEESTDDPSWDHTRSDSRDVEEEERMRSARIPSGLTASAPVTASAAAPPAPPSPFDVPMTSSAAPSEVGIQGGTQQQALHPRGSAPMQSPFSTDE